MRATISATWNRDEYSGDAQTAAAGVSRSTCIGEYAYNTLLDDAGGDWWLADHSGIDLELASQPDVDAGSAFDNYFGFMAGYLPGLERGHAFMTAPLL